MAPTIDETLMDQITIIEEALRALPKTKSKRKPKKKKGLVIDLPHKNTSMECLYRFLLTASPDGRYTAGTINPKRCYIQENTEFVKELVQDEDKAKEFLEVLRFFKSIPVRSPEPTHRVLAVALKCTNLERVKNLIYSEALNLADDCETFFSIIHQMDSARIGFPNGWRRFVSKWYKSIPPSKLAAVVVEVDGRHGWTHSKVIGKAHGLHPAEKDIGLKVIEKYIFNPLPKVVEEFEKVPEAKDILETLKKGNEIRTCDSGEKLVALIDQKKPSVAQIIMENKIAKKNTPGIVWKALMKTLSSEELLKSIQTMHNHLGLIDYSQLDATPGKFTILQLVNKQQFMEQNVSSALVTTINNIKHVSPVLAYMTLRDYEEGRKRMSAPAKEFFNKTMRDKETFTTQFKESDSAIDRWSKLSRKGELMPPSGPVIEALTSLVNRSLAAQPEDKRIPGRYLVTVDARSHMFKVFASTRRDNLAKKNKESGDSAEKTTETSANNTIIPPIVTGDKNKCFWAEHVNPGKAAILLALYFVSHVENVTVAVFTDEGIEEVSLTKNDGQTDTMSVAEEKLTSAKVGKVSLCSPVQWAKEKKEKYDLFINILRTASVACKNPKEQRANACNPHQVLYDYQKEMDVPHAGLVNICLGKLTYLRTDFNRRRIMDIFGLDEHVTELIHMFASDKFKDKI